MARLAWLSSQYPGSRHGFQEKHPPFWARGSGISTQAPDTAHPKNQGDVTPFLAEGVQSWHFLAFRALSMWDISSYSPGGTDSDGADVCRGELSGPRVPWRASRCRFFFFRSEQVTLLLWGMCSKNICYGHLWTMIWMWLWNVMNIFLAFYKLMVIYIYIRIYI